LRAFQLSLTVDDAAEAEGCFAALADGGQVSMPLTETCFSPCFGMVLDRFGVAWMVIVPGKQPAGHRAGFAQAGERWPFGRRISKETSSDRSSNR
jgi:hypothetical protein